MREIIFRGRQVYGGKWIYGSYIDPNMIMSRHRDEFEINQPIYVVAETIGQYTELKDRNGTKIFEGDILKADNGHIGYVEFGGLAQFGKYCECHKEFETIYPDNETVIGNIHDNPELLKGDKQ